MSIFPPELAKPPLSMSYPLQTSYVEFSGVIQGTLVGEVIGLNNGGTFYTGRIDWSPAYYGGGCEWGGMCGNPQVEAIVSPPIALGEAYAFQWATPVLSVGGSSTIWTTFDNPSTGSVSMELQLGYTWNAVDTTGMPADVLVTDLESWTSIEFDVLAEFELDTTPLANYCASQANGTGAHGSLAAFGSPQAESEWLTIRTANLPNHSAGILFMGTDTVIVPGSTTTLCVGGNIRRVGGVQAVSGGYSDFEVDLIGFLPGDSARFQCFHRDPVVGVAATDAFVLTVQ